MAEESSGYWRGLIAGVLVGAGTALILAPRCSEEMRQDLSDSASTAREKAGDLGSTVAVTARDLKGRGQELLSVARSKVGDVTADAADHAGNMADNARA